MATVRRLVGGRKWVARISLLLAIGLVAGLILVVMPVLAAVGDPIPPPSEERGVTPVEVDLGGQPNDCAEVGSGDLYDFRIENPSSGEYTDTQSGSPVTFDLSGYKVQGEDFLDFSVSGASVYKVIIKGGTNSALYDYIGSVVSDEGLHATRKDSGKLYSISHTSFCYDLTATISGRVFFDANANSAFDDGEPAEELIVRLYDGSGSEAASQVSTGGDYSFSQPIGGTYTVCLDRRDTHQQTIPDLPPEGVGVYCDELGDNEPVGYSVELTANVTDKDFGNLPLITCGVPQQLPPNDTFVSAEFSIFTNSIQECGLKGLSFFYYNSSTGEPDPNGDTAAVLLDGQGGAAGRGVFVKEFASAADFVPLVYAPTAAQLGSAVEPSWCNVRTKAAGDGIEFAEWLGGADYPSLVDVVDAFGAPPEVCKVAEIETVALVDGATVGIQTTVVYTLTDDPWFK